MDNTTRVTQGQLDNTQKYTYLGGEEENQDPIEKYRGRVLDITKCLGEDPPKDDFIFRGFHSGTVGGIVSPGGTGKSLLALHIAVSVASGKDLLGLGIDKFGPAVYISMEDDKKTLHRRLKKIVHHHALDEARVSRDLVIFSSSEESFNILDMDDLHCLCYLSAGARLIIFDTLSLVHNLDENKSQDMKSVLYTLKLLCAEDKGVLFLHHTSKASSNFKEDQTASRGSSVLTDNIRWQGNLVCMSEAECRKHEISLDNRREYIKLVDAKTNYGSRKENSWFRIMPEGYLVSHDFIPSPNSRKSKKKDCALEETGLNLVKLNKLI